MFNKILNYILLREYLKAGIIYLFLICAVYSSIVFSGRTLSAAAHYPWFSRYPPKESQVMPNYPFTLSVDIGTPATIEEPQNFFIGKQLRKGVFPMWDPFIACGTIVQERLDSRSFFPYQLLQNICPWQWVDFFLLGRLFFAAMGVFIFLKLLNIDFYPSLCGGILYGFSGAMTVFLNLTEMSNVGMVLPYLLLCGELLYLRQNILYACFCSLITALFIVSGQPEASCYGILLFFSYYLFRVLTDKTGRPLVLKKVYLFLFPFLFSILISSPLFVPFLVNSNLYSHLHMSGHNQGTGATAPVANFMAVFLPELLRWRSPLSAYTENFGWDWLGGYVGITCFFIIFASFRKHWWGRNIYLFFLCFGMVILLKNMGVPIITWIGKLPILNQIWTPRWTGPIWNLSLVLSAALGFQSLLLIKSPESNRELGNDSLKRKSLISWILVIAGILIVCIGALINLRLYSICNNIFKHLHKFSFRTISIFMAFIGILMFFIAGKRLKISKIFFFFSFIVVVFALNFKAQLSYIYPFIDITRTSKDKIILFSMWEAVIESIIFGITVIFTLSLALKERSVNIVKFKFVISAIIISEMLFHVTIGYDEQIRFIRLFWHFVSLFCLSLYLLFSKAKSINNKVIKIGSCSFFIGMIVIGIIGARCVPKREQVFEYPYMNLSRSGFSRIMGISGWGYPNGASVSEIQDIKSVVCLSIKRFQLFQDYCLLFEPQDKWRVLWFPGVRNRVAKMEFSENLRRRHHFYSLAGISNYLSRYYEDIPHTKLIHDGVVKNYLNLEVMPRAFLIYKWFVSQSPEESLAWMLSHADSLNSEAVVESKENVINPSIEKTTFVKAKISSYDLHSVTINAETESPALLILTDSYHPSWEVSIDGKKDRIYPVYLCFRGVFLKPGKHEVKFIYYPKVFYACVIISGITLLILFMLILRNLKSKKSGVIV